MRILHIIAGDKTPKSESRFMNLLETFSAVNLEQMALLAPNKDLEARLTALSLPYKVQKFAGLFDLRSQKAVKDAVKQFKPHIIHSHSSASAAFVAKTATTIPHITFLSSDDDEQKMLAQCDCAIKVSFQQPTKDTAQKIRLIPPFIAIDDNEESAPPSRKELGVPENVFLIGTSGTFTQTHKLDKIFLAIREMTDIHFCVAGAGPDLGHFEDKAVNVGVQDRVHFIAPPEHQTSFLKALDACIIPTYRREPEYLTLAAWAARIPVVSGNTTAQSPITSGQNGLLLDDATPLKWRSTLQDLQDNPEQREKLAAAGYETYTQHHTAEAIIRSYLQAYESVLRSKEA